MYAFFQSWVKQLIIVKKGKKEMKYLKYTWHEISTFSSHKRSQLFGIQQPVEKVKHLLVCTIFINLIF